MNTCPRCKRPKGGGNVPMEWHKRCHHQDSVECLAVEMARKDGYEAGFRAAMVTANAQAEIDWQKRPVLAD